MTEHVDEASLGDSAASDRPDAAMTRSEEVLRVRTERIQTGRVRLRKYIVTEQVTMTVPVSHEEVRLEHVPLSEQDRGEAPSDAEDVDAVSDIILYAERPIITMHTVAVERVRLVKETVIEQQQISEQLRKEHIEEDRFPK